MTRRQRLLMACKKHLLFEVVRYNDVLTIT